MTIITNSFLWILIGLSFIIAEFSLPAIGLLFLGLGSLTNSVLVYYYDISLSYQLIYTGLLALIWFMILWAPLNKFIYANKRNREAEYFDLVGTKVQLISDKITPGSEGTASWSGTIMRIKLLESVDSAALKGDYLYVNAVKGNILYCSKKNDAYP